MEEKNYDILYSKNVIEFVTVVSEYCKLIESCEKIVTKDFLNYLQKVLSLLYIKATLLPKVERNSDGENEKFVSEDVFIFYRDKISEKLDEDDIFMDIYEPQRQEGEKSVNVMLSEALMDIFQDVKDFLSIYQIADAEAINEALCECSSNFEIYWGPRLLASLSMLHNIMYSGK